MDTRLNTFIATDGTILKVRAVRDIAIERRQKRIEEMMRAEGAQLDPPTKTTWALGGAGDKMEIPLTERNLEVQDNPEQTARNRAMWDKYQSDVIKLATLQQEEHVKTMLALGVEIEGGVPPLEEWRDELEYVGVEIPEHELDIKAYYLLFIVLTDYDLNVLLSQIRMLGMGKAVSGEDVETFQTTVQSEMGESVKTLIREAKARLERARMEGASAISGNEGGEELGVTP